MSEVLEHYHYLHEIPELGFQEVKTSAYIADQLEKAGLKVTRNINNTTGIVAEIDSGVPGPVLALRADMDALGTSLMACRVRATPAVTTVTLRSC